MRPALACLIAVTACHRDDIPQPQPTAVKVAVVERASTTTGTRYSAQINPATRLDLSFKAGGYVDSIVTVSGVDGVRRSLQEGDRVRAGMQLAALQRTDNAQRLAEAQAALVYAKVAFDQARLDYNRTATLAEHNAVAGAELDAARTRRDAAAAALSGAQARGAQATSALGDTTLKSPLDGIVLKRAIEVGAFVAPGTVAFSIADVSSVKAVFGVPDVVLPQVQLGSMLKLTTEAYPGETFMGQISLIGSSADPRSRVFEIEVTIPNSDGRLKPGLIASLSLGGGGAATPALPLIPLSAIVHSPAHPGKFAVFVVDATGARSVAQAREIELSESLDNVIQVTRGLNGGETVVVQGAGLLSNGETVEVIR